MGRARVSASKVLKSNGREIFGKKIRKRAHYPLTLNVSYTRKRIYSSPCSVGPKA